MPSLGAQADAKLFEAVFESMPQLYLQMIVLLFYADGDEGSGCLPPAPLYLSVAIGVASNTLGLVTKFVHVIGFDGNTRVTVASAVYFAADATTRAIAVAMVYGWIGGGGIAAVAGGLLVLDLVLQQLGKQGAPPQHSAEIPPVKLPAQEKKQASAAIGGAFAAVAAEAGAQHFGAKEAATAESRV